ncbi:MAG: phosphatidylserine decarboxylase [Verrucomicrobiota bacterium]|nr:phosphatidylserine decarboxylase [Verrucomicrobiota bacterium]
MATNPDTRLYYYNRHTRRLEVEAIYGEAWLRWCYTTVAGRLTLWAVGKRAWVSIIYGGLMRLPSSQEKIKPFIDQYKVDVREILHPLNTFKTFNEFFIRQLKPAARPILADLNAVVFPADGRHRGYASSAEVPEFRIKGEVYSLDQLCGWPTIAKKYHGGPVVISRLCPVDYHRFHFPVAGVAGSYSQIRGVLDSVSPLALACKPQILFRNKRQVCEIASADFGQVCMVEIGAACVGAIHQTYALNQPVQKGGEKGYFSFGGSCVVTLFEPQRINLAPDLLQNTREGRELYAKMGTLLGTRRES